MATITVLDQQFRDGKPSGFKISLSDGTNGYLDEKASDKGLRVGDTVNFTAVTPEGKNYKKITCKLQLNPPMTASKPDPNNPVQPRQPQTVSTSDKAKEWKAKAAISALEFCHSSFDAGKFDTTEKLLTFQKEAVQILWDEIDEIFGEK